MRLSQLGQRELRLMRLTSTAAIILHAPDRHFADGDAPHFCLRDRERRQKDHTATFSNVFLPSFRLLAACRWTCQGLVGLLAAGSGSTGAGAGTGVLGAGAGVLGARQASCEQTFLLFEQGLLGLGARDELVRIVALTRCLRLHLLVALELVMALSTDCSVTPGRLSLNR
jgi:hypothetical protein